MQDEALFGLETESRLAQGAVTPLYAVFGQPIAHSQSPAIHLRFAAQSGVALRYDAIEAGPDGFAECLAWRAASTGKSCASPIVWAAGAVGKMGWI